MVEVNDRNHDQGTEENEKEQVLNEGPNVMNNKSDARAVTPSTRGYCIEMGRLQ